MKKKVIIGFILTIIWMVIIFLFSSRSSAELDVKNSFIVNVLKNIFYPKFDTFHPNKQEHVLSNISFFVSKSAHYIEYAILAFFLFFTFAFIKKYGIRYSSIIIISLLYAISDEYHQTFSSGRTPRVQDVCIDTLGAITMVLFIEFILTIYRYKKSRRIS